MNFKKQENTTPKIIECIIRSKIINLKNNKQKCNIITENKVKQGSDQTKLLRKKIHRKEKNKTKDNLKNNSLQFFSPDNPNKLNNIIEKLESAKTSLDIAMYTLTNIQLINTIMKCYNNKVKIRIILLQND